MKREGGSEDLESLGRPLGHLRDSADGRAGSGTLWTLLADGVALVGAAAGGIFMLDEAEATLELTIAVQYPELLADRYRLIPLAADVPLSETVRTGEPIFLGSLADYAVRFPAFARMHPEIARNAFVSLPLVFDGHCMGAIALGFDAARTFASEEAQSLLALAVRCACELDRLRILAMEQSVHRKADIASQRLERLHAFTGRLAEAITPPQVLEAVIEVGLAATSAQSSALWLSSPDGAELSLGRKVGSGGPGTENFARLPIDTSSRVPAADAARDGIAVWIESRSQLAERYPALSSGAPGADEGAFAALPLVARGRRIGVLTFGFEGPRRFLEDERAFLQVISWYAAQALERANLYASEKGAKERAEDGQRRSALIADIDVLLASSLDYSNILADVARAAVPRFADWCVLELVDHRLPGMPVVGHTDPSKAPLVLELRRRIKQIEDFNHGITAVMRSGVSRLNRLITPEMLEQSLKSDASLRELAVEVGVASAVAVPISARGQVLGALLFARANPAHPYDDQDVAVGEDLGRRIGLAVDNARLYQEARDADRLKDELLAMLSHELRNPLAPIVTALDLMELTGGEHFAEERAMISRHVSHLVRLLDDLLDVARTTRGKVQLVNERCEVTSVVAAAVEMASALIVQRGHRLRVSEPERGLEVIGDRARLTQAIANLVTNAAKYTAPGGDITVTTAADGKEVVVCVRDSGMGIVPELLPRIFEPFVQGAIALDRTQGGLGIGLTIAKTLVSLHRGTLSAHSEGAGRGSEFVVRLPRAEPAVAVAGAASPRRMPFPEDRPPRVLAIDDNRDAADMLGRALEALGCSASVVYDSASALASMAACEPQLVLLDIGLPGIDGYEVARRLRESRPGASFRIVAVTGYGQPSDRLRSQGAGFDDHVVKPVTIDVLQRILDNHLRG